MKLPETFLPNKDLEKKTKQLLKEYKSNTIEKKLAISKAKKEFPRLIDHLQGLYSNIRIIEKENKGKEIEHQWKVWFFYDSGNYLGSINTYNKNIAPFLFEQGYSGQILFGKKFYKIECRKGHYFDDECIIVKTEELLRRDSSNQIPFP